MKPDVDRQTSTTGAYRIVTRDPLAEVPAWFRMVYGTMERFGFPTLVAIGLALGFVYYNRQVRADTAVAHKDFLSAMQEQAKEMHRIGDLIEMLEREHRH